MIALAIASSVVGAPAIVRASQCRIVDVDYLPVESPNSDETLRMPLSMVVWIEDGTGAFIETVFITQQVGTFGLGNRPGRFDFNSGPNWPYGRRITTFPVWAHRHGLAWDTLEFQDASDSNLSHATTDSSPDARYCKPLMRTEPLWDTGSCASTTFTDKGEFGATRSLYPPRQDVMRTSVDSPSVDLFSLLYPFDSASQASPKSGQHTSFQWAAPPDIPVGDYVMWFEVSREFDHNASYSVAAYPAPHPISFEMWGMPYRGQPSILYRVPFTIGDTATTSQITDYAGYGDPDGADGDVRPPDGTITIDTPGSGAQRLGLVPGGDYRIRVATGSDPDTEAPNAPGELETAVTSRSVDVAFVAPGDDGSSGQVKGYQVRYLVGEDVTEQNFDRAVIAKPQIELVGPGQVQTFALDKLLPETTYAIGVRAFDNCANASPVRSARFTTTPREVGEVDACFIATAAYGSLLANDVEALRRFRDLVLDRSVLGELFVTSYYTFGPAVAGVVGESELLRASARTALGPLVSRVKSVRF